MPSLLDTLKADSDALLDSILTQLTAFQMTFLNNRGQYWGAGGTHSTPPAHSTGKRTDTVPDRLEAGPPGWFNNWLGVAPEWVGRALPCNVRVGPYNGPMGDGYTITLGFTFNGDLWERTINVGPEVTREQPWALIPPD